MNLAHAEAGKNIKIVTVKIYKQNYKKLYQNELIIDYIIKRDRF